MILALGAEERTEETCHRIFVPISRLRFGASSFKSFPSPIFLSALDPSKRAIATIINDLFQRLRATAEGHSL